MAYDPKLAASSYTRRWASGKNVSPSALVFDMGIRLPLDHLLNLESCRTEVI
jgi:hypothetical protein